MDDIRMYNRLLSEEEIHDLYGEVVSVKSTDYEIASGNKFSIQNYPNPFNLTTTIYYTIPKISFINIRVFDVLGREITVLVDEVKPAGKYEVTFSGDFLPSGIYLCRMQSTGLTETKKILFIK